MADEVSPVPAAPVPSEVVTGESGSVSMTVPTAIQGDTLPPDNQAFLDQLPEIYRDKGWAKEIKDMDGFAKSYEDTKAALSRRPAGIPDDNASPEDKAAFNKARGVPESADQYQLEALPEGYTPTEQDTKIRAGIQDIFHKADLDPSQAKLIEAGWNELVGGLESQQGRDDAAFDTMVAETYGDKADAVMASNKALIEKHTDPKFLEYVGTLDNRALMALSTAIDGIKKEYIGEDKVLVGDVVEPVGARTNDQIRAEMAGIMGSEAFQNPSHQGHDAALAAKNALVAQLKL